ncbi:phage protein [Vibrio fluvialis]|nr:phage protein [Vibrio fluvialis]ELI1828954.1 phage protein [Vibrio fluvialis]
MKYHEMTKNYIFREFECGLTREQAAELCFKSVRTVTDWDKGKPIPPECRRLMRMYSRRLLGQHSGWEEFKMVHDRLELPTGKKITPQQLILGIALLEIQSELELKTSTKLLKFARSLIEVQKKIKAL